MIVVSMPVGGGGGRFSSEVVAEPWDTFALTEPTGRVCRGAGRGPRRPRVSVTFAVANLGFLLGSFRAAAPAVVSASRWNNTLTYFPSTGPSTPWMADARPLNVAVRLTPCVARTIRPR